MLSSPDKGIYLGVLLVPMVPMYLYALGGKDRPTTTLFHRFVQFSSTFDTQRDYKMKEFGGRISYPLYSSLDLPPPGVLRWTAMCFCPCDNGRCASDYLVSKSHTRRRVYRFYPSLARASAAACSLASCFFCFFRAVTKGSKKAL